VTTPGALGRAQIEITPKLTNFGPALHSQLNRQLGALNPVFSQQGRTAAANLSTGAVRQMQADAPKYEREGGRSGTRFVSGLTASTRTGFRTFAAVAATGLAGVSVAAVGATAAGATLGVKTAASLEMAQVAFTTLLHSGERAKTFLSDLSSFAAATPFTLPGLVDASRQLLGVGANAKTIIPTLTAWGDTSGALGLTQDQFSRTMIALTQSMANGKIQAGDMLQITQAGIPIWAILARSLGKPVAEVRKLSENGKLLTADVLPKLEKQMEKDYGGSMAKQAGTLNGIWSTFTDTLNIGLATAIQPLIPMLKTGLTGAIHGVGAALAFIPKIGAAVGPAFREIRSDVGLVISAFKDPDVTASGFHGVLETIGSDARRVFDVVSSGARSAVSWFHQIVPPVLEVGRTVTSWLVPSIKIYGQYITQSLIPTVRNLILIFRRDVAPVLGFVARVVGGALLVGFRVVALTLQNVVGPVLVGVTGFFRDHEGTLRVLAITIGVLVIPKLVALGVAATVSAARQVAAWLVSGAASVAALVKYEAFAVFAARYYVTVAAQAAASAIRVVAAWVMQGVAAIRATVVAVAQFVIQGARWVWLGVIATASAIRIAAAWLISMGPIAIVIAAVIAFVVIVALNWRKILNVIVGAVHAIGGFLRRNWPWVIGLLTGPLGLLIVFVIKHWDSIKRVIGGAIDWVASKLRSVGGTIAKAWSATWSGISNTAKSIWSGIKEIFAAPVRFVVNTVIGGVVRAANWLLDKIHLHIPEPHVNFATGGRIPGYGGGDTFGPVMLERGETVVPKHLTTEIAPWARRRGIPGFQGGGIVGAVGRAVGVAFNAADWVSDQAVGFARKGAADAVQTTINPIVRLLDTMTARFGVVGDAVSQLGHQAVNAVITAIRGREKEDIPAITVAAGAVAGSWRNVFLQALRLAGQPESWVDLGLRRLNQESGGNPSIVNRWDSNWTRGTPSVGLMQVIGPTFASNAGRFRNVGPFLYGTSINPLANIFAAIMYTVRRYGSLAAWGKPGGYDVGGGKRWPSGTAGVNLSGEDEFVWRRSQLGGSGTHPPVNLTVSVDARGAADPQAVKAAVRAGGTELMEQITKLLFAGTGA
jgi:tape measure domain-containing protein